MPFEDFLGLEPYSLNREEKHRLLTGRLKELTQYHRDNCEEYDRILSSTGYDKARVDTYEDLPFLPVRLFKDLKLKSVSDDAVVKTMTSSGTTGQSVSKIYLDRNTSANQQKTMVKIVSDFTGSARMPMIIIDCPSVIKDRNMFSARGAGILGFSIFGSKKIYALNDDMHLDVEALTEFLEKFEGQRILLFGFTFMVWQYFYKELVRLKEEGITFDLSNAVLIHGGGWKKLASEAVSAQEFHDRLNSVCGIDSVHDYYGMVEQTGCIYMQCECGHLHASNFSDVIIRNPKDFSECAVGKSGIIQVVSSIPESYPGHSLLTEDEGLILGEDDCPCGRKGKYFRILGRIKNAEIRGCSDTFAAKMTGSREAGINVNYLIGSRKLIDDMITAPSLGLFDESVLEFINEVSGILMKDKNARAFSDVVTLAFWLRKSSVTKLAQRFAKDDGIKHVGKGLVFHIAPSNVPVNYAYSLFTGLMCGNRNIVRLPSKDFAQVAIINNAIEEALEIRPEMKPYICLVKYDRSKEINDYFSSLCDARVIWGGDLTIAELQKSPLKAGATEVTFADRYSLAVIDADRYIASSDKDRIASDFYNDTYLSDQNACTSPRLVVWLGNEELTKRAKEEFWARLYNFTEKKYALAPVRCVDKLTTSYEAAATLSGGIYKEETSDNMIIRMAVTAENLTPQLMDYRGNCGYFYECRIDDVMELKNFCDDVHCQTVSVLGDTEMISPLVSEVRGIYRVTMMGHSMDFDLKWDGYDLTEELTKAET